MKAESPVREGFIKLRRRHDSPTVAWSSTLRYANSECDSRHRLSGAETPRMAWLGICRRVETGVRIFDQALMATQAGWLNSSQGRSQCDRVVVGLV